MKKLLFTLIVCFLPFILFSQAKISFEKKEHNFGRISEDGGTVSYDFIFKNEGNMPLKISTVRASCGCTTPDWTKEEVAPGQKGKVTVLYNPQGVTGKFAKQVVVYTNSTPEADYIIVKGEVTNSPQKELEKAYPLSLNGIRLSTRNIEYNNIDKGTIKEATLKIKNTSISNIKISFNALPGYLSTDKSSFIITPDSEEEIVFSFNSKKTSVWGPIEDYFFIVFNNEKKLSDEYKINVHANIVEDFSKMTIEQKRNAPILEIPVWNYNFGKITFGTKTNGFFIINNIGDKALVIRRILNTNKEIAIKHENLTVKGGKKSQLKFILDTADLKPGKYKRALTLQTNDPENVYIVLAVEWEIE